MQISFYLNGKPLGVAFVDLNAGAYFPAISLYKNIQVRANFGPDFACPPPPNVDYKPVYIELISCEIDVSSYWRIKESVNEFIFLMIRFFNELFSFCSFADVRSRERDSDRTITQRRALFCAQRRHAHDLMSPSTFALIISR